MSNDYKFFKEEAERIDEVKILAANELKDPPPNYSGSFSLDYDLVTPFPEGRIIEVYGNEGSCKTTLVLEVAGRAIQNGKAVLYINMERNLTASLLKSVRTIRPFVDEALANIDNENLNQCPLRLCWAPNGEAALETMRKFCLQFPHGIAILDSIDAAQPEAVLSGEIGELKVGNLGKLMSDALRKLIVAADNNHVTLIFVNQTRQHIGGYGQMLSTPGGNAIKFYASQRIELLKPAKDQIIVLQDKDNENEGERIGVLIRYKIVKNKLAPDGIAGEFPILFGHGIFREKELIDQCLKFGVLKFGGKGGRQVLLPSINRETKEFLTNAKGEITTIMISRFNAARKLLLDSMLTQQLEKQLRQLTTPGKNEIIESLLKDEV